VVTVHASYPIAVEAVADIVEALALGTGESHRYFSNDEAPQLDAGALGVGYWK
jgi:hypothetical protein